MSDPNKHHYLPQFYLDRWRSGEDNLICRFSRPYKDNFIAKRGSPKSTAYENHLYSMHSPHSPPDADMESHFLSKLDSEAALALDLLERGIPKSKWTQEQINAWSRFIWAQKFRSPDDIAQLKSLVRETWRDKLPELEGKYQAVRAEDGPENIVDWILSEDPKADDRFAFDVIRMIMDHTGVLHIINTMHWKVLDFQGCGFPLLTSDRPLWMTPTLAHPHDNLQFPISPTQLFVATGGEEIMFAINKNSRRQQAKAVNKRRVTHAANYVFGTNDKMLPFVKKHFATRRHSTTAEMLTSKYGYTIVDGDSPLAKWL